MAAAAANVISSRRMAAWQCENKQRQHREISAHGGACMAAIKHHGIISAKAAIISVHQASAAAAS